MRERGGRAVEHQHREQCGVAALQRVDATVAPGEARRAEQADAQFGVRAERVHAGRLGRSLRRRRLA